WSDWMRLWADTRIEGGDDEERIRRLAEATASEFQLYDYYDKPLAELYQMAMVHVRSSPQPNE
ncbi:MAG: hypothetical protein PVJ64_04145, partial [Gemmatimonadales bacterium]